MIKIAFTCSGAGGDKSSLLHRYWTPLAALDKSVCPVALPLYDDDAYLDWCAAEYDGFVFTGGTDLDPVWYGETNDEGLSTEIDPLRDRFELGLARRLLSSDRPVLGICRGIQTLCVAAGGTLWQDIHSEYGLYPHRDVDENGLPHHTVHLYGRLRDIVGTDTVETNSYHHQSPKMPGENMDICARHRDGLIESIMLRDHPFFLGLQWHPEINPDWVSERIFARFLEACREK